MLNVGIFGCGVAGMKHARAYNEIEYISDILVWDPDDSVKKDLPNYVTFVENLYDKISTGQIDIVSICSPPQYHEPQLDFCLESDVDILIEKPVHIPSSKLNKIFNKETNRRLSVVHQFKYSESVGRVKNLVSSNALGEIEYIKKLFVRERTGRMLHDKSHWSNDLPMGRWQETLPHPLYTIYYLLGGFEATNAKVRILASKDDLKFLIIILEFGDGITFELFFKESNVTRNSSYEITGSSGSISFNNSSFQLMTHSVSSYRKRLTAWIWNIYAEGIVIFEKLKSEVKYYLIKDFRYGNNLHDKFISDFVSYTLNQGKSPASHREIFEIALLTEKIVHEFDEATKNH